MKKTLLQTVVSAALAVSLTATVALAAPVAVIAPPTAPAFTVRTTTASPVMTYGQIAALGEKTVRIENDNEKDPLRKLVLNITDQTMILDAVTGASKTLKDLRAGEDVYAYVSPVMTRSMPPISNAELILCGIPADFGAPTYAELHSVTAQADGSVSAYTDRDVILRLSKDTELLPYRTKNVVTLDDLVPGSKVLAWYSLTALSMPAQATPSKLMLFPSTYSGYVSADAHSVTVGADKTMAAKVVEGTLFVSVRTLAQALDCKVEWLQERNSVAVSQDGKALYEFVIGGSTVTVDGQALPLTAAPGAENGTTYMALDDLLALHNLKLVQDSGF